MYGRLGVKWQYGPGWSGVVGCWRGPSGSPGEGLACGCGRPTGRWLQCVGVHEVRGCLRAEALGVSGGEVQVLDICMEVCALSESAAPG